MVSTPSPSSGAGEQLGRLIDGARLDARMSWRHLRMNALAAAFWMPRPLRYLLYRAAGIRTETPNIFPGVSFRGPGPVAIGKGSFVNTGCIFEASGPISVGRDTHLAMEVMLITSDHPFSPGEGFSHLPERMPIVIGDRCWLGARVTVLPGVTIGDDVVVAAGAVVTSDCAPGGLYGGVPARRIRDIDLAQRPAS